MLEKRLEHCQHCKTAGHGLTPTFVIGDLNVFRLHLAGRTIGCVHKKVIGHRKLAGASSRFVVTMWCGLRAR